MECRIPSRADRTSGAGSVSCAGAAARGCRPACRTGRLLPGRTGSGRDPGDRLSHEATGRGRTRGGSLDARCLGRHPRGRQRCGSMALVRLPLRHGFQRCRPFGPWYRHTGAAVPYDPRTRNTTLHPAPSCHPHVAVSTSGRRSRRSRPGGGCPMTRATPSCAVPYRAPGPIPIGTGSARRIAGPRGDATAPATNCTVASRMDTSRHFATRPRAAAGNRETRAGSGPARRVRQPDRCTGACKGR